MSKNGDTSGGQFPTVRIGNRTMYQDYHGGLHPTQHDAIESNAGIEIGMGRQPCQRGLNQPGFIPGPRGPSRPGR